MPAHKKMTEVTQVVEASRPRVFAELADGWAYVGWVVGATHVRHVEDHWPAVGSKIHHMVGAWPAVVSDNTEVLELEQDRRIVLQARGWPMGEATVEVELTELAPDRTRITLREAPTAGPGSYLDNPALRWVLKLRNRESMRRLKDRVEHRPEAAARS